jgi:SNF2 family DNA or RNA helicase
MGEPEGERSGVVIKLWLEGRMVAMKPMGWLDERFSDYKRAIEGAIYNKTKKLNFATLDKAPGIINRLNKADFPILTTKELDEALSQFDLNFWDDVQAARERAAAFDEDLKKVGKHVYPYQYDGIVWLSMKFGGLLADDMGLGKTLQCLAALPANAAVIVVCPKKVKSVWRDEIKKWRPGLSAMTLEGRTSFTWPKTGQVAVLNPHILPDTHTAECLAKRKQTSRVVKGKHLAGCRNPSPPDACKGCLVLDSKTFKGKHESACENRERKDTCKGCYPTMPGKHDAACLKAQGNIFLPAVQEIAKQCKGCLTPAETVRDCTGCLPFLKQCPDNVVLIFDEGHVFASGNSLQSIKAKGLAQAIRSRGGRTWITTGTPLMNSPADLWNVLSIVMCAQEAFGDYKTFLQLFDAKSLEFGGFSFGTPETAEVAERIQRVMLRRMRREVFDQLPKNTIQFIPVEVDRNALEACDEFMQQYGGIEKILKELGKSLDFKTMSKVRATLAKAKIPAMLEHVETFEEANEPLVVFCSYRAPIDKLAERDGWMTITGDTSDKDSEAIIAAFQAGKLKGIGMTIRAGGAGITLTRSCYTLFVDEEWNPGLNAQARGRTDRIGQERPCWYGILVSDHPLDSRVAELIEQKQEMADASVNAARDVPGNQLQTGS